MVNRKITLLVTALFVNVAIYAQTDWGWDWKDSSKVSVKDKPQQSEFLNNSFPYPAKPQNQAELGFGLGTSNIIGNVNSGLGANLNISYRKALGHVLSYRISYDYSYSTGKANNVQTQMIGYALAYRNKTQVLSLDGLISLNTLSFYRGNPKFNIYGLAGFSLEATQLQVDKGTGTYGIFYYHSVFGPHSDGLITSLGTKYGGVGSTVISQGIDVGGGISYKVNNKINVGFEKRYIISSNPFQDGYNSVPTTNVNGNHQVTYSQEIFSFTNVRVNINIGNTATKVQPLWWINPNNYIYSELNNPRHMKLPKPNLQDSDGDGVIDQFDLEPNTPAGSDVNTHGVSLDTDGDGVPDYKDKEKLTSQKCFPVNNDGIGVCPEPSCCKEIKELLASDAYKNNGGNGGNSGNGYNKNKPEGALGDLPNIQFNGSSNKLSKASERSLDDIAKKMKDNPDSKIKLIGYGAASKAAQQLSWERVNAIKRYLVKKGIAEDRIIFTYGQAGTNGGESNTVDIQSTTENQEPNRIAPPHPNLSHSKTKKGKGTTSSSKATKAKKP